MEAAMLILAGLGNPGPQVREEPPQRRLHGRRRDRAPLELRPGEGQLPEPGLRGRHRHRRRAPVRALILKPQTFMNESGRAVGEAMHFFKLTPADVVVFYDELDLAPGRFRMKTGGGAAGHNGIRSIAAHIGPDFRRARIGIGHPGDKDRVLGYVLDNFHKAEQQAWVDALLPGRRRRPALPGRGRGRALPGRGDAPGAGREGRPPQAGPRRALNGQISPSAVSSGAGLWRVGPDAARRPGTGSGPSPPSIEALARRPARSGPSGPRMSPPRPGTPPGRSRGPPRTHGAAGSPSASP